MSAPTEHERLNAELIKLIAEGRPDLAREFVHMVGSGKMTVAHALEALDYATRLAYAAVYGEITDDQGSSLVEQLARRQLTGRAG